MDLPTTEKKVELVRGKISILVQNTEYVAKENLNKSFSLGKNEKKERETFCDVT